MPTMSGSASTTTRNPRHWQLAILVIARSRNFQRILHPRRQRIRLASCCMAVNRHFLSSRSILSIEHSMPCSATALRTSPYATAGKDGRGGERGPKGERGERGLIGPKGDPAPTITGWRVDCAAYTAVPLLSNGS